MNFKKWVKSYNGVCRVINICLKMKCFKCIYLNWMIDVWIKIFPNQMLTSKFTEVLFFCVGFCELSYSKLDLSQDEKEMNMLQTEKMHLYFLIHFWSLFLCFQGGFCKTYVSTYDWIQKGFGWNSFSFYMKTVIRFVLHSDLVDRRLNS